MTNIDNQDKYTWMPAFEAISNWIVDYEDKQEELVDILIEIGIDKGLEDESDKGVKTKLKEIDPFTFFLLLMKFQKPESRINNLNKLIKKIGLKINSVKDVDGVPTSNPQAVWLFGYGYERTPGVIKQLWDLFKQAKKSNITSEIFDAALGVKYIGFTKLTQTLFYIKPSTYLPIDSQTKPWLTKLNIDTPNKNFARYQACMDEVVRKTNNKPFWEISYEAWLANQKDKDNKKKGESSQDKNEMPKQLDLENKITTPLNRILYGPPGTGKTYQTTELAVQCLEPDWFKNLQRELLSDEEFRIRIKTKYDELTDMGRIAFTTFHQSFSYEDFVEGIRPNVTENEKGESLISYEVAEGVFKQLCNNTITTEKTGFSNNVDVADKRIWKMSLGNTSADEGDIYDECLEKNYVLLG